MKGRHINFMWNGLEVSAIVGPQGVVGDSRVPNGSYMELGEIMALTVEAPGGADITEYLNEEAHKLIEEALAFIEMQS